MARVAKAAIALGRATGERTIVGCPVCRKRFGTIALITSAPGLFSEDDPLPDISAWFDPDPGIVEITGRTFGRPKTRRGGRGRQVGERDQRAFVGDLRFPSECIVHCPSASCGGLRVEVNGLAGRLVRERGEG